MSKSKKKVAAKAQPGALDVSATGAGVDRDLGASANVDEASDESFPASDPPSWTAGAPGSGAPPPEPTAAQRLSPTRLPGLPPPIVQSPDRPLAGGSPAGAAAGRQSPVAGAGRGAVRTAIGRPSPAAAIRARIARGGTLDPALVARAQGGYFLATGLWPLLHLRSFEAVTGGKRKNERWLVKTVGVLASCIGASLLASTRRQGRPEQGIRTLGVSSALGFLGIDLWYVKTGQLSPMYLLDAAAEAALVAGWLGARR